MTAYLAPQFDTQFFDGSTVAAGYKLYTYDSGTTTPKAVYSDQAGVTPHANPIILDANGRVSGQMFLGSGEYTFTLKTAADVLVKTWNDVGGSATADQAVALDTAIRADLASKSDASKGSGMSGHGGNRNYAAGTIGAIFNDVCVNPKMFPWLAKFDGVTDDTSSFKAMIASVSDGARIICPVGVAYFAAASGGFTLDKTLSFEGAGPLGTVFKFEDGAYIGISSTSPDGTSGGFRLRNIALQGTNTTTPAITLLKLTNNSAYVEISGCHFFNASICAFLAKGYVVKVVNNQFSGSDTFIKATSDEGSVSDLLISGNTFGSTAVGSSACLDIKYNQCRIVDNDFETDSRTKDSILLRTGSQDTTVSDNQFINSGGIRTNGSNMIGVVNNTFVDTYDSVNGWTIRVDAGSDAIVALNRFKLASVVASTTPVSSSGATIWGLNIVRNYATGSQTPTSGVSALNLIAGCTTGISRIGGNGALVIANYCSGNTTDISSSGTDPYIALNYASVVTDTTGGSGMYFANAPASAPMREYYANATTYDPPSLADGAGVTTTVFAPSGVSVGDLVFPSFSQDLQGIMLTAWVSAPGVVSYRFQNETGGAVDLASGTLRAIIREAY